MKQRHHVASAESATLTRRTVLQGSLGVASAMALNTSGAHWLASPAPKLDYYKVVFDHEHPAAHAFGETAAASGLATEAIHADVTRLWYDDLYHRWRKGPVAIAGMTPVSAAFCLQVFAQDVGMRMVYRAEHKPLADGRLQHRIDAPVQLAERSDSLRADAGWARAAARLVSACPAAIEGRRSVSVFSARAEGFARVEPLVSWVIAPVRRA